MSFYSKKDMCIKTFLVSCDGLVLLQQSNIDRVCNTCFKYYLKLLVSLQNSIFEIFAHVLLYQSGKKKVIIFLPFKNLSPCFA